MAVDGYLYRVSIKARDTQRYSNKWLQQNTRDKSRRTSIRITGTNTFWLNRNNRRPLWVLHEAKFGHFVICYIAQEHISLSTIIIDQHSTKSNAKEKLHRDEKVSEIYFIRDIWRIPISDSLCLPRKVSPEHRRRSWGHQRLSTYPTGFGRVDLSENRETMNWKGTNRKSEQTFTCFQACDPCLPEQWAIRTFALPNPSLLSTTSAQVSSRRNSSFLLNENT